MSNHSVDCTYCHEDLRLGHHGGLESLCPQRPGTATSPKTRRCGGLCVLSAGHAGGCFSPVHVLTYEDAANYWLATQDNAPAAPSPSPETPTPRICPNCKQALRPNEDHFAYAVGHTPSSGWMCPPPSAPRETDTWLSAVRWSATLWNNVENRDALNALAAQLPELGKARSRLAAAVARIEFLEAEEGRWDRVTDMAFICEAQAQCPARGCLSRRSA